MKIDSVLGNAVKMWCARRGMVLAKYASSDRRAICDMWCNSRPRADFCNPPLMLANSSVRYERPCTSMEISQK